jgi:hypothetical protein
LISCDTVPRDVSKPQLARGTSRRRRPQTMSSAHQPEDALAGGGSACPLTPAKPLLIWFLSE